LQKGKLHCSPADKIVGVDCIAWPVPFDRRDLETWATAVWPLVEYEPNVTRWAARFVIDQQATEQ
jgi:hypothetical protein